MKVEDIEKNIREFMKIHGIEGFLILYFSNYLMELILSEVKSKIPKAEVSEDPSIIFFYKDGEIQTLSGIHSYEKEIYKECRKRAGEIVRELKKEKQFEDLFRGNIAKLDDPALEKIFEKKLHEILERWREGSQ